jgi:hypothetical protein
MESKLPVPTDNIFKFYALFSLLLLVFSVGAIIYVQKITNDLMVSTWVELDTLQQAKDLPLHDQARMSIIKQQHVVAKEDKKHFNQGLGGLIALAIFGIWYGFRKWHTEVQPLMDESARVQLAIAKLQLERLQIEVDSKRQERV